MGMGRRNYPSRARTKGMNEALPLIETLFPRGIAQYLIGDPHRARDRNHLRRHRNPRRGEHVPRIDALVWLEAPPLSAAEVRGVPRLASGVHPGHRRRRGRLLAGDRRVRLDHRGAALAAVRRRGPRRRRHATRERMYLRTRRLRSRIGLADLDRLNVAIFVLVAVGVAQIVMALGVTP